MPMPYGRECTMFVLQANKNRLEIQHRETLTSGSVNVYTVRFEFVNWNGLTKKAAFRGSGKTVSVLLDENGECVVPWEVLTDHGGMLLAGAYGTQDDTVLPTMWTNLGMIFEGTPAGENAHPPTPDLWEQELTQKGDGLAYDGLNLSLLSGEKKLSTVQIVNGGDGEGIIYEFGHGLKQEGLTVSVDMASSDNPDKSLPISAAAVDATVGNIEILLKTI